MNVIAPRFVAPRFPAEQRVLRVAVLVDLMQSAQAGGHVKCWERLAEAALGFADRLDLTLYFMGAARECKTLGANVRYVRDTPIFSTAHIPFLSHVPDHTDLAPFHPRLARRLADHDLIHTTDAYFAYARTAERIARRRRIPLVNSVHTDTPQYARIFTTQTVERLLGKGAAARLVLDRLGLPRYAERRLLRQLAAHQRACAGVLVSRPDQLAAAAALTQGHAALLRRGIDRSFFHPNKRDRAWLAERFGIPPDRVVVLFAGRVNRGKHVMVLAEAMADLPARGVPVHLLCAGDGEQRGAILDRLGGHATCPGNLDQETLARAYASADLFAFPSPVEECANVVHEALASGLPVLVASESGMGRIVIEGETGFALASNRAFAWSRYIALLAGDPARRAALSLQARRYAERRLPSWAEVLEQDLLPQWQRAALSVHRDHDEPAHPAARTASGR